MERSGDTQRLISSTDEEKIWEWNASVPAPQKQCLHDIFQETARRFASATAVCAWDKSFTYQELECSSSRLAVHLIRLGVGAESPVVVCFDKSAWAVVATFAVLKAGGAFVPVAAGNPDQRTLNILKQTRAHIVLTQESYLRAFEDLTHKAIVVDEQLIASIHGPRPDDYSTRSSVHQAAYIIFTSGSTGQPKGVVVEHAQASTSVLNQAERFKFSPNTRQLQFSSYIFDMSVSETFATILTGGCLCVPSESQRIEDLAGFMSETKVNAAILTPTMARRLDPSRLPELQSLCMGAEAVSDADLTQWRHVPRLLQGYGPTECSAVTHTNTMSDRGANRIGTATGCVGWIIDPDDDQRLVPLGEIGELAIEGHILARGYLEDAQKTSEAFIRDPAWLLKGSSSNPGRHGRVYKTGDLVYYNQDGVFSIIGRKDTQIKIRGQRVELGEVETSLREVFPEADSIVAEMVTPGGHDRPAQLAAFLTGKSFAKGQKANDLGPLKLTKEQQRLLSSSVRPILRPALFFTVHSMPTTASGKLDRKRLRELASMTSTEAMFPTTEQPEKRDGMPPPDRKRGLGGEELIRQLWSQCLHIDEDLIKQDSDFFSLGGTSITVIELIAEARKHGIVWKMAEIFQQPTFGQLAASTYPEAAPLSGPEVLEPFALLPPSLRLPSVLKTLQNNFGLKPHDVEDIYPATPAQEHLASVTAYRTNAFTLQLAMRIPHAINVGKLQRAIEHVVGALPLLRTRLVKLPLGPALQVVMNDSVRWRYGTALTAYLVSDQKIDIDFGDPLARFGLVHDLNEEWLVLSLHHALWDRWSLPAMLNMFGQVYYGQPLPDAPLLKNFIKEADSAIRKESHDFWDEYLEHQTWNNFPKIPSGIMVPRATETIRRGFAKPTIKVPGITLSVVLRATWAILQSRSSGSDDVLFGTTVFGRNCSLPKVEAVIGPTIATVPVRMQVLRDSGFQEYLNTVQRGVLDSAEHEHAWLKKFSEQSARKQSNIELNTLFVVQPRENQKLINPFKPDDQAIWLLGPFDDHCLLIQCEIFDEQVVITANFDPRIVRDTDVQRTLDLFQPVCESLAAGAQEGIVDDLARDLTPWRPAQRDPKQSWGQWLCCCFVIYGTSFLYGLDFTITACMQDSIVASMGSATDLAWIGMGFPLGSLILILPVGYVFGLFENRILYGSSIVVFLVGSVVCGAAPNIDAIIAGRIVAGAGGGGMYLGALNAIGSLTKRRERTIYAAFTGFAYGIGVILGPIIGGALASSSATWRWGFYIVAIVAGVLSLSTITLPAMEPRPGVNPLNTLRRMDWIGTALFAGLAVTWSVLLTGGGADWNWLNARTWVLLAIFLVALICFIAQQSRNLLTTETWKVFPAEFLRSRALVALFVATAASASALYVTTYYTPLIFQFARGDSALDASVKIIPLMALFIFAVVLQGVGMPRLGAYMPWYIIGGIFITVGGALMCTVTVATSAAAIMGYTVLVGLGGGLCLQAAYAITTAKVKGEKLASAIGFINVGQIGAGVVSLTIAGTIYQNLGTQRIAALGLSSHGAGDINAAIAGLSNGTAAHRKAVAEALTETIQKVFILVAVAGAMVVLSGLAMPVETLFYTKKKKHKKDIRRNKSMPRATRADSSSGGSKEGSNEGSKYGSAESKV